MKYTEKLFEKHIEESLLEGGYQKGNPDVYNKSLCVVPKSLMNFIKETQPNEYKDLLFQYGSDTDLNICRIISDQINDRGVIDVFRNGVNDRGVHIELVYFQPKSGLNPNHKDLYKKNEFKIIRQLKYSLKNENSIDMGIFINGIPVILLELKNSLTGQDHINGIEQWRYDRDPNEALFKFKKIIVYFAVGNEKVYMTTKLIGKDTNFLPFNKGIENPINKNGHKTHYLWEDILQKDSILDLIENYVHIKNESKNEYNPITKKVIIKNYDTLVFPRYHQLNLIRLLKNNILKNNTGHQYLIQHSTGSGKSLSIGWLAHMLISLFQDDSSTKRIFDSVVVVTDRKILNKQISNTLKQLEKSFGVVNPVENNSQQLKQYIEEGKQIISTTIQKFPVISKSIAKLDNLNFAVIIDEVHSSQGGESSKHLNESLSNSNLEIFQEGEDIVDLTQSDKKLLEIMKLRGKQPHISYFGFSGTPTNKTFQLFGTKTSDGFRAFDIYSMKQSIAEKFTLDVLHNYTTYRRYFKMHQKIIEDRKFPERRANRKLINWVDIHPHSISAKTNIILDHFKNLSSKKIEGNARAMLVTKSRLHCVKYKIEFDKQMKSLGLPYKALVGFSGTVRDKDSGQNYTETLMNEHPDSHTAELFKDPKFRILIVNNKYQTGFDEPLLHTMYVDKKLSGLQCVQTLSRLNRIMKGKTDTMVIDFVNNTQEIKDSFQLYYESTLLEEEVDPNIIYTLQSNIDNYKLFSKYDVEKYVQIFISEDNLEKLQSILDTTVENWKLLDNKSQELYNKYLLNYIKIYNFISQVVSFKDLNLEKLFIYLQGLFMKLPKSESINLEELSSLIDLEQFKIEKKYSLKIELDSGESVIDPVGIENTSNSEDPEEFLKEIIQKLNESFDGNFNEKDKVKLRQIIQKINDDDELRTFMITKGNSETNLRNKFYTVIDDILLDYTTVDLDFYKKVSESTVYNYIKDRLYNNYSKSMINN